MTDQELNNAAAESMGMNREYYGWSNNEGRVWDDDNEDRRWSPATNIAQAFLLQAECERRGKHVLFADLLYAHGCDWKLGETLWAVANAPPRARTEAAVKALASPGGK